MSARRNALRLVVLVWLVLTVRTGFATWHDHEFAVVQGPITATNPDGLSTQNLEYACAAPMRADEPPRKISSDQVHTPPKPPPCTLRSQRQAIFWVDIAFGILALAATFAHVPRRWALARRGAPAAA